MIQVLFWSSVFFIFWTYIGYYLILKMFSLFYTKDNPKDDYLPKVTLIITAYNEEKRISEKLDNVLELDYPRDKLETIVVSDGSTDRTNEIVGSYREKGIKLLARPVRKGKHHGQIHGIMIAENDLLILSDATTFLKKDAISKIVRGYANPEIGCISGYDMIQNADGNISGESAYVSYEMSLRILESKVGSLIGASGSFYSVRKSQCATLYPDMSLDFYLPILTRMNGLRTIIDTEAWGYYKVINQQKKEFNRKVRTIVHGIDALFRFKKILNPFKYGFFSYQIICHKLMRWLVPWFMLLTLALNFQLYNEHLIFEILLVAQLLFYMLVLVAFIFAKLQKIMIFKIPLFFAMVNLSTIVAWYKYFSGEKYVSWEPTKR